MPSLCLIFCQRMGTLFPCCLVWVDMSFVDPNVARNARKLYMFLFGKSVDLATGE